MLDDGHAAMPRPPDMMPDVIDAAAMLRRHALRRYYFAADLRHMLRCRRHVIEAAAARHTLRHDAAAALPRRLRMPLPLR